jgi:DNA primase
MARISDQILDEIRSRLTVSNIVARRVALKRAGREWKGLSPFKTERSPSFFVNDHKGFYHCFASGEHGDIFSFVMHTEGLSFREAVEKLAAEANVNLPKDAPATAAQIEIIEQSDRLRAILNDSAAWYAAQLATPAGAACRAYLTDKRSLTDATSQHFGLGYAPKSYTDLKDHLLTKGHAVADMVLTGMLIDVEGKEPYDRFRNRAMFPIHDPRGRMVGFGGRALDPDQNPKYLNTSDTPLFQKGELLYNFTRARQAAHDARRVIVSEGYMDVIGLHQGGIPEAVAALGTAMTIEHMTLLWRLNPEPILLLDGDAAGQRAAARAIDIALPDLEPDQTLSFAMMPDGQDPDDLIKSGGKDAVEAVIAKRIPLIDALWRRETAHPHVTPEQRVALEQRLTAAVSQIKHSDVRRNYLFEIKKRLRLLFSGGPRPPRQEAKKPDQKGAGGNNQFRKPRRIGEGVIAPPPIEVSDAARQDVSQSASLGISTREAVLILLFAQWPDRSIDQTERLTHCLLSPAAKRLLSMIEQHATQNAEADAGPANRETVERAIALEGLTRLFDRVTTMHVAAANASLHCSDDMAAQMIDHVVTTLVSGEARRREIDETLQLWLSRQDEAAADALRRVKVSVSAPSQ